MAKQAQMVRETKELTYSRLVELYKLQGREEDWFVLLKQKYKISET